MCNGPLRSMLMRVENGPRSRTASSEKSLRSQPRDLQEFGGTMTSPRAHRFSNPGGLAGVGSGFWEELRVIALGLDQTFADRIRPARSITWCPVATSGDPSSRASITASRCSKHWSKPSGGSVGTCSVSCSCPTTSTTSSLRLSPTCLVACGTSSPDTPTNTPSGIGGPATSPKAA